MSLLEDVFLEDEAGEAQELERIIEGDEFDERPRSVSPNSDEHSEKEDEAEEDKRRVDPTQAKPKRVIKNPRFILNPARLTGPRGIQVLPEHYKDFKFKGKGHEREDLDLVLKKLEHWAYRLYPKFEFSDCLRKIETLGKKRPVMVHLQKIRSDQLLSEETVVQKDSSDEEAAPEVDEFDVLLQQQIDLARATPAPLSAKKGMDTPMVERSFIMPKATSSPSINDEQRERMLRNRRLAEERRLARLKQNSLDNNANSNDIVINDSDNLVSKHSNSNVIDSSDEEDNLIRHPIAVDIHDTNNYVSQKNDEMTNDNVFSKKHNKSNVIDSSDEETDNIVVGQSITVDIHAVNSDVSQKNDDNIHDNVLSKKHNKTNVIDSSQEETDNYVVGQSITVDTHSTNSETSQSNDKVINDNEMFDNTAHNDIASNDISVLPESNTVTESENKSNDNDIKNSEVDMETNKSTNSDNLKAQDTENIAEEVMDVDFSDDF